MTFKHKKLNTSSLENAVNSGSAVLVITCLLDHRLCYLEKTAENNLAYDTFYPSFNPIKSVTQRDVKAEKAGREAFQKVNKDYERAKAQLDATCRGQYAGALGGKPLVEIFDEIDKLQEQTEDLFEKSLELAQKYGKAANKTVGARLSIITPDGKALAWACASCFNAGISGSSRRTRQQKHTGRVSLWHLIAILANLETGQLETVVGNEASAKKLGKNQYNTLSKEGQSRTQKLYDKRPLSFLRTTGEEYKRWEKDNHVFSGLSKAQKLQRYGAPINNLKCYYVPDPRIA